MNKFYYKEFKKFASENDTRYKLIVPLKLIQFGSAHGLKNYLDMMAYSKIDKLEVRMFLF